MSIYTYIYICRVYRSSDKSVSVFATPFHWKISFSHGNPKLEFSAIIFTTSSSQAISICLSGGHMFSMQARRSSTSEFQVSSKWLNCLQALVLFLRYMYTRRRSALSLLAHSLYGTSEPMCTTLLAAVELVLDPPCCTLGEFARTKFSKHLLASNAHMPACTAVKVSSMLFSQLETPFKTFKTTNHGKNCLQ